MRRIPASLLLIGMIALGFSNLRAVDRKSIELPADHAVAKLKPGHGADTVEANCLACHSTDYLVRQPGGDAKRWMEVVNKMVKVYGATVTDEDAKVIADYLGAAYPPAPAKKSPSASKPSPQEKPKTR